MPTSGLANRQSHSRTSSQSLLGPGPINSNNRVTRRKSMNNGASNVAAITAAILDASPASPSSPSAGFGRRHTLSKGVVEKSAPTSLLTSRLMAGRASEAPESAIDDEPADVGTTTARQKPRTRRASDGQPLTKEGRKSSRVELRCETCGKGYKHSSCLTKHLWEHTPEWSYTSKLLISKHQQVQLLEAATVLVAMNNIPEDEAASTAPPNAVIPPEDYARAFPSDNESASPAASGYSELNDRQSSANTTPPPHPEAFGNNVFDQLSKRYSDDVIARSYQSTPVSGYAGSVPYGHTGGFGHSRQQSHDRRPPSSGRNATGQDDRELAAAVELLSCSFNSNNGGRGVGVPRDAPPVPPLPVQYLDQAASLSLSSAGFINSFPSRQPESFTRGESRNVDVKMEESADSSMEEDEDENRRTRARSDEDEDGVFGRMVL